MSNIEISICIPLRGAALIHPDFLVALSQLSLPPRDKTEIVYKVGSTVDRARNWLVKEAKGDYILFLDSDTVPPQNGFHELLRHDLPIVSGLYFKRSVPFHPMAYRHEWGKLYMSIIDYPKSGLIEVDSVGLGFVLIKREVFEKVPAPWFFYNTLKNIGEDFYFCEKARKYGYKIMVDCGVKCGHIMAVLAAEQSYWGYQPYLRQYKSHQDVVSKLLGEQRFKCAVDLGCSALEHAVFIRKRAEKLIGVDSNSEKLKELNHEYEDLYDELVQCEIRNYTPPTETDVVFIMDGLEHIPKKNGLALLKKFKDVTVVVTTPSKFHDNMDQVMLSRNPAQRHVCVYREEELRRLGFKVAYADNETLNKIYGRQLVGIREARSSQKRYWWSRKLSK